MADLRSWISDLLFNWAKVAQNGTNLGGLITVFRFMVSQNVLKVPDLTHLVDER